MTQSCKERIKELQYLDKLLTDKAKITQIRPSTMSNIKINNISVCDASVRSCSEGEINYKIVLDSISIKMKEYIILDKALIAAKVHDYIKHPRFSVFIKSGAFGDIYGSLIDHKPQQELPDAFDLNGRYKIYIGKSMSPNIYYFSN